MNPQNKNSQQKTDLFFALCFFPNWNNNSFDWSSLTSFDKSFEI